MKKNREQELLARLALVQRVSLAEAMELFDTSESTIRRLFTRLEQEGKAIRTHGGIQNVSRSMADYSFEYGARTNIEKKTAIARQACQYLVDGDVVFCDSGTTIQCFCVELIQRLQKEKLNIQIYTNSLANLELLSPHMTVKLVGGSYRANRKDFCGYMTEQALGRVFFTKSFVGTDGCVEGRHFTTTDFETARMNEVAIRNSEQVFMLADSSKFSHPSHVAYVDADRLDTVITDTGLNPDTHAKLRKSGCRVVCVEAVHKKESK